VVGSITCFLSGFVELLAEATVKYPHDPLLWKSLGMIQYQKGEEDAARKALEEALRLSPDDRQARFVVERLKGNK